MSSIFAVAPEPDRSDPRLTALGLDEPLLREVVSRGLAARNRCNPFHPPSFPGTSQWAESHVALREMLTARGWRPDDTGNFSTIISPDGQIAITIAAGTERTGRPGLPSPHTKYSRGPMTHAAVLLNRQLELRLYPDYESSTSEEHAELRTPAATWILLVATSHNEVRYELSRPADFDERGRVVAWSERILLTTIDTEPITGLHFDDDQDDDIDVPVERL